MADPTPYETDMRGQLTQAAANVADLAMTAPPRILVRRLESALRIAKRLERAHDTAHRPVE